MATETSNNSLFVTDVFELSLSEEGMKLRSGMKKRLLAAETLLAEKLEEKNSHATYLLKRYENSVDYWKNRIDRFDESVTKQLEEMEADYKKRCEKLIREAEKEKEDWTEKLRLSEERLTEEKQKEPESLKRARREYKKLLEEYQKHNFETSLDKKRRMEKLPSLFPAGSESLDFTPPTRPVPPSLPPVSESLPFTPVAPTVPKTPLLPKNTTDHKSTGDWVNPFPMPAEFSSMIDKCAGAAEESDRLRARKEAQEQERKLLEEEQRRKELLLAQKEQERIAEERKQSEKRQKELKAKENDSDSEEYDDQDEFTEIFPPEPEKPRTLPFTQTKKMPKRMGQPPISLSAKPKEVAPHANIYRADVVSDGGESDNSLE